VPCVHQDQPQTHQDQPQTSRNVTRSSFGSRTRGWRGSCSRELVRSQVATLEGLHVHSTRQIYVQRRLRLLTAAAEAKLEVSVVHEVLPVVDHVTHKQLQHQQQPMSTKSDTCNHISESMDNKAVHRGSDAVYRSCVTHCFANYRSHRALPPCIHGAPVTTSHSAPIGLP
jgi:hypothetical protein